MPAAIKNTLYKGLIERKVVELLQHKPIFHIDEFAAFANLPVTGNMRRRLAELVYDNVLETCWAYPQRGRMRMHFMKAPTPEQLAFRNAEYDFGQGGLENDTNYNPPPWNQEGRTE